MPPSPPPPPPLPFIYSSHRCCDAVTVRATYSWLPIDHFSLGPVAAQKYLDALPKVMTFHLNGTVGDFNYLPVFSYTWVSTLDPKVFPGLPHTAQLYLFKYSRTIPFGSGDADVGWLITDTDPRDMARGGLGSAMLIAGVKEEDSLQCPQDAGQQW